jgi:hypothetical protein
MTTYNNNTPQESTSPNALAVKWSTTTPIRYDALGNPGLWHVRCEFLGANDIGVDHPSLSHLFELAAYSWLLENPFWPALSDGIWVEIRRQPNCRFFVVDGYVSAPTQSRPYKGMRKEFAKMEDALRAGEAFVSEAKKWILDEKVRSLGLIR